MNPESLSEILQVEFATWKKILKIDKTVIIVTNEAHFKKRFNLKSEKNEVLLGAVNFDFDYVLINLKKIGTYKELVQTIIHELLHLKHPKKTETQILRLEKGYLP
jgi:hypothetical protein